MSWGYVAVAAATVITAWYSGEQQEEASEASIAASREALDDTRSDARQQFDLVREDTALQRAVGDQALMALGFMTGVLKPPTQQSIQAMKDELARLTSNGTTEPALTGRETMGGKPMFDPNRKPPAGVNQSGGSQKPSRGGTKPTIRNRQSEYNKDFDLGYSFRQITGMTDPRTYLEDPTGLNKPQAQAQQRQGNTMQSSARTEQMSRVEELRMQIIAAEAQLNMANEMGSTGDEVPDLNSLFSGVEFPSAEDLPEADSYLPALNDYMSGLGQDLENSAGYQFELKQGREALQTHLSATGDQYGGNAIKAAIEYGQDYASTKYAERHGQALQEFDREYQSGMTRYGMDIDKYNLRRQEAIDQYGMNLDQYNLATQKEDRDVSRMLTMAGFGPAGVQTSAASGRGYMSTIAGENARHSAVVSDAAYGNAAANIQGANQISNTAMTLAQYNQARNRGTQGG